MPNATWLKRAALPLLFVGGVGAYVLIAGVTGFCPACQSVTSWLGLGETKPPPVAVDAAARPPAPVWTMAALAGQPVASSSLAGKVALVEFWSMSCPDCLEEISTLSTLQKDYGARGLVVLGACLDTARADALPAFIKEHGMDYPVLLSNKEAVEALGGVKGTPTAVLLDRQGRVVQRFVGYTEPPDLTAAVAAVLAESAPSAAAQ